MGVSITTRLRSYLELLALLAVSISHLPLTLAAHPLLVLTSPSAFRERWFGNVWRVLGPKMALSEIQVDHIDELLSRAHGRVLELGPGQGDQMYHYKPDRIDALYAAEPNAFLHQRLIESAEKLGLAKKLVVLEAGAQPGSLLPALENAGVYSDNNLPPDGVFDTVVAVKSLCSAPQDQLAATVAVVQALLKPGGEFLFFEHVANDTDPITRAYAWLFGLVWPVFMGGCHLNGKVDKIISGMGGWDDRKITTVGQFQGHEVRRERSGSGLEKGTDFESRCLDMSRAFAARHKNKGQGVFGVETKKMKCKSPRDNEQKVHSQAKN
jgi:SAM-dependent methyltransferase